jgi:nitrilase
MKIAILQTDALPFDKATINYYLSQAKRENAKLFILPEYVLNRFFKELESMPVSFIKNQSTHQTKLLKQLSLSYNITILAPIVLVKGDKKYKVIGRFFNGNVRYYYSQVFMPYHHWNEEKFFSKKQNKPLVFNVGKYRIGALFGFESHFDEFWKFFREKKVDIVAVLSVGAFNSHKRWYEMLKTRAFLNNVYVVRANRVGEWEDWEFYGKSFVISPEGEEVMMLGNKEELGIVKVSKEKIKEARKEWKFSKLSKSISF